MKKKNTLNGSENDLLKTPTFLYAIGLPIGLSCIAAASISMNESLILCLSHECFNNLLQYFKVPLGLASIAIPLGALAAAQHRSQQTLHQISLQRAQNNLTGYFTHREKFKEYCQAVFPTTTKYDSDFLHERLFQNSKGGDYGLSYLEEIVNIKKEIEIMKYKVISENSDDQEIIIKSESISIDRNLKLLGIEYAPKNLTRQLLTVVKLCRLALFMDSSTSVSDIEDAKKEAKSLQCETQELREIITANRHKRIEKKKQTSP